MRLAELETRLEYHDAVARRLRLQYEVAWYGPTTSEQNCLPGTRVSCSRHCASTLAGLSSLSVRSQVRQRTARLGEAQHIAQLAYWEWVPKTSRLSNAEGSSRVLGVKSLELPATLPGFVTDAQTGECLAANQEMLQWLGLPKDAVMGRTMADLGCCPFRMRATRSWPAPANSAICGISKSLFRLAKGCATSLRAWTASNCMAAPTVKKRGLPSCLSIWIDSKWFMTNTVTRWKNCCDMPTKRCIA